MSPLGWGFKEKGWTDNEHPIEWLKEVFIPQSRRGRDPDDASYWRLLIVDGHGSHTSLVPEPFWCQHFPGARAFLVPAIFWCQGLSGVSILMLFFVEMAYED